VCQLIGGVQQPSIAGFGGKQQHLAKGNDASVVPRSTALDVTNLLGKAESLAFHPLFSCSVLDLEPYHFLRS